MLRKIILAVIVGVVVTLGCVLVGSLLQDISVKLATTIGNFLQTYSAAIGILSGLWYFFSGRA